MKELHVIVQVPESLEFNEYENLVRECLFEEGHEVLSVKKFEDYYCKRFKVVAKELIENREDEMCDEDCVNCEYASIMELVGE